MNALGFVAVWVIVVAIVFLFAFTRGGDEPSKPTRFSRTPKFVRLLIALSLLAIGVGVPLWALSSADDQIVNGSGHYEQASSEDMREGRVEFRRTCASCHTLTAANARGVFGPNLDRLPLSKGGIVEKIEKGGADSGIMPAGLLTGESAEKVAAYVEAVGGLESP